MRPGASWAHAAEHFASLPQQRCEATAVSSSIVLAHCSRQREWAGALDLLKLVVQRTIPVDEFSYNSAIAAFRRSDTWKNAIGVIVEMETELMEPDAYSWSAVVSACEGGNQWQASLHVEAMHVQRVSTGACFNALLSALAKSKKWLQAIGHLYRFGHLRIADIISWNVAISSVGEGAWTLALRWLSHCLRSKIEPDKGSCNLITVACKGEDSWHWAVSTAAREDLEDLPVLTARVEACGHGRQWQAALGELTRAWTRAASGASPDVALYTATLGACAAAGQPAACCELLQDEQRRGLRRGAADFAWALARLGMLMPLEPEMVQSALNEARAQLLADRQGRTDRLRSRVFCVSLTRLWWSLRALQASHRDFEQELAQLSLAALEDFRDRELMLVAWAASGRGASGSSLSLKLLIGIQTEVARHLALFSPILQPELVKCVLGVLWSCSFSQSLSTRFYALARRALRRHGLALDSRLTEGPARGKVVLKGVVRARRAETPRIVLDLADKRVVLKPSGWEVHDGSESQICQLRQYLQELEKPPLPILDDSTCSHGFLHRLDVPSSGLILAAKSFRAYFDLQAQLAMGLPRGYYALCHGLPVPRHIEASVSWLPGAGGAGGALNPRTVSGGSGKFASTRLSLLACGRRLGQSFGLCCVKIRTGRRHQIRSHVAHIGHPTVSDGKYSSQHSFETDMAWFPRNGLHRFYLAFQDEDTWHNITEPPTVDFLKPLQMLAWDRPLTFSLKDNEPKTGSGT